MPQGLEAAFAENGSFLWGLAYRLTGDAADAEDVVQETFTRARERPPRRMDVAWLLRDVFDYSVRETAQALGSKPDAVKATHLRARAASPRPLVGRQVVATLYGTVASRIGPRAQVGLREVNGLPAAVVEVLLLRRPAEARGDQEIASLSRAGVPEPTPGSARASRGEAR